MTSEDPEPIVARTKRAGWQVRPDLAFVLAQHLHGVTKLIEQGVRGTAEALAGLDRAIEALMPHTRFRDSRYREIARKFYLQAVAGKLSTEQEDKLRELDLLE